MVKAEQVPVEVVTALQLAVGMSDTAARGLVAVLINAWPGMGIEVARDESEAIILPLTTEKQNAET